MRQRCRSRGDPLPISRMLEILRHFSGLNGRVQSHIVLTRNSKSGYLVNVGAADLQNLLVQMNDTDGGGVYWIE